MLLHPPDPAAALAIEPLLERGKAALRAHIASLPPHDQPLGGPDVAVRQLKAVVTIDDFIANAGLCFSHVVNNGALLHILCEGGAICAVFDKRVTKW